jgi:curli biogenesis system outer membrane secretion channel CsgG
VAIEPFTYAASGLKSGSSTPSGAAVPAGGIWNRFFGGGLQPAPVTVNVQENPHYIGPGVAAQLLTALANSGNIQIVEYQSLKKTRDGGYTCKLEPSEYGPFIIKGAVTEFNETADLSGQSKGGSLGGVGAGLGVLGAVTGSKVLTYGGSATAIANPTYTKSDVKRKGMVAMDIKIVNGKNTRITGAFHSAGTFTTMSSVSGMSVFGIGSGNTEFAASAIGQATRSAMNDAVQKITDNLKTKVRKK